jgi:hypothetical protein
MYIEPIVSVSGEVRTIECQFHVIRMCDALNLYRTIEAVYVRLFLGDSSCNNVSKYLEDQSV